MVVHALLAIGHDMSRQSSALRRAVTGRSSASRGLVGGAGLAVATWFIPTLGANILSGDMAGPLAALGDSSLIAFFVFVAGSSLILLAAWLIAAFGVLRRAV
jgi:hypothetical protein